MNVTLCECAEKTYRAKPKFDVLFDIRLIAFSFKLKILMFEWEWTNKQKIFCNMRNDE